MKLLEKDEMLKINGGGFSGWGMFGLGTFLAFLAGVVDGFARPFACHK